MEKTQYDVIDDWHYFLPNMIADLHIRFQALQKTKPEKMTEEVTAKITSLLKELVLRNRNNKEATVKDLKAEVDLVNLLLLTFNELMFDEGKELEVSTRTFYYIEEIQK